MSHWYLIHTKIRQESVALANLERQGYRCFLPLIRTEKVRAGRLQVMQEPLFPRYLFVQLGTGLDAPSWAPIRSTLGVTRLVTFGQTPGKVSPELIALLQARSDSAEVQMRQFAPGDAVVITEGPFAGMEAIYHMAQGEERVMVLLNILSKMVKMTVSPVHISKPR
jgi:transcriptional antiterminator RfaH